MGKQEGDVTDDKAQQVITAMIADAHCAYCLRPYVCGDNGMDGLCSLDCLHKMDDLPDVERSAKELAWERDHSWFLNDYRP